MASDAQTNGSLTRPRLFDSSVLFDVFTGDPAWQAWSRAQLRDAATRGLAVVNQIIYTEVAAAFSSPRRLEDLLEVERVAQLDLPWNAAWPTSRAFKEYRRRGGTKRSPMPDFYIGGHAEAAGLAVVTRDARRIRTYFPSVPVVSPDAA